jgi:1-acyl-sn-glycerol-3-phosphate acyltransferase
VCSDNSPFEDVVVPRDGLFRLALSTNTPIVPAFAFGERRSYESSDFLLTIRLSWVKKFRVGIPVAWGKHKFFPFVPKQCPITIVVGKPTLYETIPLNEPGSLDDTSAIESLRERYIKAMNELFEEHKGADEVAQHKKLRWLSRSFSGKAD